jgi:hypothetical protein
MVIGWLGNPSLRADCPTIHWYCNIHVACLGEINLAVRRKASGEARMAMDKKAVKEWKAQYQLINDMEREELRARLETETIEESVRRYFAWNKFVLAFARRPDVPEELQESKADHYLSLIAKWETLAQRVKNV